MEAYPLRMRQRIIALYERGHSTAAISGMLGTCQSGTRRTRQRLRERGTLRAGGATPGRKSGLTDEAARRLREHVAAYPDATRQEIRGRLGLAADVRTIGRWLGRLGLPLKRSPSGPPSRTAPTSGSGGPAGTGN
jgi:transposase